ncbi:DUF6049 family protein [Subtercola sp. YIM 133946]|uniref:DUF6049 family protein n=1 Tax=Subtercola sp. YIM 133946 TaxID=3118909 RepID=UPI002F94CD52
MISGVRARSGRTFASFFAAVLTLVLIAVLGMPGAPAARADNTPSPTSTGDDGTGAGTGTASATPGTVDLALAPDNGGTLSTGQDLGLTVTITNNTADTVPATAVHVWLDRTRLSTRAGLTAWLTAAPATQAADSIAVDVTSPAVGAGQTATLRTALPAAQLGLNAWGAYGIEATGAAGAVALLATSVVTWSVGAPASGATVGMIMPLTVAPGVSGVLTATDLAAATAPNGVLSSKLDAVIGRPVTLAIDPMVIVSIRALGTAAPQSALDWLAKLAAASNPTFALGYADADLSIQHQANLPTLLAPTSFDYALNPANFQSLPSPDPFSLPGQVAPPVSTPGATVAPTPTPTPAAGTLPSFADLTTWNYTRTDIAWPAADTVSGGDLTYFAANGLTSSILSSANVKTTDPAATPNAPAEIDGSSVVIADAELSDALQQAVTAATEAPRDAALAEVSAELAIITAQSGQTAPALVASLGRAAPSSSFAVTRSLDAIEALPWAAEVPLSDVLTAPQTAGVSVVDSPEPADRVAAVNSMLDYEQQVYLFAPVIDQPDLITGKQRATLLAVLNQSWLDDPAGQATAIQTYDKVSNATLSSVQIVDGSTVNLLATNGDVPVPISNDLDEPVTVTLQVTPSNARLVVDPNRIEVTIEAHSQKTAKVPVKAVVATGQVDLSLQLYNQNGVLISSAAPLEINVSADWEGIGTLVIGILAGLLLVFGVVRQILKRRRAKQAAGSDG